MSKEEVFRQARRKISPEDVARPQEQPALQSQPPSLMSRINEIATMEEDEGVSAQPLQRVTDVQRQLAEDMGHESPMLRPDAPIRMTGNPPPMFQKMLQQQSQPAEESPAQSGHPGALDFTPPRRPTRQRTMTVAEEGNMHMGGMSDKFIAVMERLSPHLSYEQIELPSRGKFYTNIPGVLHVRAMTGYEEHFLTASRFVKNGTGLDNIIESCVEERINACDLLTADRNYLLVYLRGISYTPEYDIEVRCPECGWQFEHMVNLDTLEVNACPDEFGPSSLFGKLPTTGLNFRYRLPTGQDDQMVSRHRERMLEFGEKAEDNTLLYRSALLLEDVEGVDNKAELTELLKKLPMNDIVYLRSIINVPPFGVDISTGLFCPNCRSDFKVELPFGAGFFYPKMKKD